MERVLMMDCGDSVRRADNGAFGKGPVVKTAAYTVKGFETGTVFSNAGAAGSVTFTLPTPKKGLVFHFIQSAGQPIVLHPAVPTTAINGYAVDCTIPAVCIHTMTVTSNGTAWFTSALSLVRYTETKILTAAVKTLRATPVTLVAAPGAGFVLEFDSAVLMLKYNSAGYTETTYNLAVKYTDGAGVAASQTIETTGFIDQTADKYTNAQPKIDVIGMVANAPLVLHNTGAAEFGTGNSDLYVKTFYRVHMTP